MFLIACEKLLDFTEGETAGVVLDHPNPGPDIALISKELVDDGGRGQMALKQVIATAPCDETHVYMLAYGIAEGAGGATAVDAFAGVLNEGRGVQVSLRNYTISKVALSDGRIVWQNRSGYWVTSLQSMPHPVAGTAPFALGVGATAAGNAVMMVLSPEGEMLDYAYFEHPDYYSVLASASEIRVGASQTEIVAAGYVRHKATDATYPLALRFVFQHGLGQLDLQQSQMFGNLAGSYFNNLVYDSEQDVLMTSGRSGGYITAWRLDPISLQSQWQRSVEFGFFPTLECDSDGLFEYEGLFYRIYTSYSISSEGYQLSLVCMDAAGNPVYRRDYRSNEDFESEYFSKPSTFAEAVLATNQHLILVGTERYFRKDQGEVDFGKPYCGNGVVFMVDRLTGNLEATYVMGPTTGAYNSASFFCATSTAARLLVGGRVGFGNLLDFAKHKAWLIQIPFSAL